MSAAASSSAAAGTSGAAIGSSSTSSPAGRAIGARCRSMGISTLTGPRGADSASAAARTSTPKASFALRTR